MLMPIEDDLLWYLTWRVRQEDGIPAKTRLVKLIYLVDLMNVRDSGQQLTHFNWIFYHYGPWAPEIERVIDRNLGNTIDRAGTRPFFGEQMFVYRDVSSPPDTLLADRVRRYCDEICQRWAVEDLNDLLSFVYFETPPMENAVRGQALNLNRVRDVEWPPRYRPLSEPMVDPSWAERRNEWRGRFAEDFPVVGLDPPPRWDEEYARAMNPEPVVEEESIHGRIAMGEEDH